MLWPVNRHAPGTARRRHGVRAAISIALLVIAAPQRPAMHGPGDGAANGIVFVAAAYRGPTDGSIDRPFRTIGDAVRAARDGDTIAVAEGRYDEGTVDLRGKALTLLGGFAWRADGSARFDNRYGPSMPTVVIGRRQTRDYRTDRAAVFLVGQSAGARIDGFTITGGRHGIYAEYSSSAAPLVIEHNLIEDNGVDRPLYDEYGGGIHSEYPALVVEHNVIRRNRSGRGAGIAALGTRPARIDANLVEGNIALGDHGGGMYIQQPSAIRRNVVHGNAVVAAIVDWMGGVGGGITVVAAAVTLEENVVDANFAKKCGAGVFVDEGAVATIARTAVVRNRPADPGGWGGAGVYVDGASQRMTTLLIDRSAVLDNAAAGAGRGNGIFVTSRAEVTVSGTVVRRNGGVSALAIIDDTHTSAVISRGSVW